MADITINTVVGNSVVLLSRVAGLDALDITQASLTSLTWKLTRVSDGNEIVAETGLTISAQVYDTLQTFVYPDNTTFDYNFKHIISGGYLSDAGDSYIARYKFVDINSDPFYLDVLLIVSEVSAQNPQTLVLTPTDALDFESKFIDVSNIYGNVYDANVYFANRLRSEVWEEASEDDKLKALIEATEIIDHLKYQGEKILETQSLSFPRTYLNLDYSYTTQTEIPRPIVQAAYELAISLLNLDPENELKIQRLKRGKFGSVEEEYQNSNPRKNVMGGVISTRSWRLLLPYLKDEEEVTLTRV